MDYRKQIDKILAASEDREKVEAMNLLARTTTVFYLALREQGLTREEALSLTQEWLRSVVIGSRSE